MLTGALLCALAIPFDFGADLRIRQEIMDHVPGLPGGGVLNSSAQNAYKNHMRFRPRVWTELKGVTSDEAKWRFYLRLTDEFRWYAKPSSPEPYSWPDELIIDNLLFEMEHIGGFFDFSIGRQDLMGLYGLDHIFVDGTPGDGSRTTYSDMIRLGFDFESERRLDLFFLYNEDDNVLRWGTERGKHRSMTGLGGGAEADMDDWGLGVIWSDKFAPGLPYKAFLMQKTTEEYIRKGVQHPWTQRELLGMKVMPQIDEEWSTQFELMGQVGRNGEHQTLYGASGYAGVNYKSATPGIKPLGSLGYHVMSGDDDAAKEDGGHGAWDPMWGRGVNDSELFLYGTHYGAAWWSNMHYVKLKAGLDFGRRHTLVGSLGPMMAAAQDGLGGGNGLFKGFLSQIRYDFPLCKIGDRFEVFGHIVAELFNPGDYFKTEKPAWFLRWQIDFKF